MKSPEVVTFLGLAISVVVISVVVWSVSGLLQRRRFAGSRPTAFWVWLLMFGYAVPVGYLTSQAIGNRPGSTRLLPFFLIFLPAVLAPLFPYLRLWVRQNGAVVRALKKGNRGDIDGAIADILKRVDRRRIPSGGQPAFASSDNPWTAPSTSIRSSADKRLAEELNVLGVLESLRDDWAKALDWFERAERVDGSIPIYPSNQAAALNRLGRPSEGLAIVQRAIAASPEADALQRFPMLIQEAAALIELKRGDDARTTLDQAERCWKRARVIPRSANKGWKAEIETLRGKLASDQLDARIVGRS